MAFVTRLCTGPHGVAHVLIYPCGKAWNPPPFPLALHRVGSVLAVQGSLRRFAPWTAPGRSERRAAYEGKGGAGRGAGEMSRMLEELSGSLAHDKGYYHSCLGRTPKGTFRPYQPSEPYRFSAEPGLRTYRCSGRGCPTHAQSSESPPCSPAQTRRRVSSPPGTQRRCHQRSSG